jgi:drug/metabolite transporter (DMT)-like permease
MLWILPSVCLVFSILGTAWLVTAFRIPAQIGIPICLAANVAFVIYAGWCDYKLAENWVKTTYFEVTSVIMFCFLQIILAPLLLVMTFWFLRLVFG